MAAAWNDVPATGGLNECTALVRSAEALRTSAPELSVQLARRALLVGATDLTTTANTGEARSLAMRAKAVLAAGLVRISQHVGAVEPGFAALALAESGGALVLSAELRLDLAACAQEVGEPLLGGALLRPVLEAGQAPPSVRAAALGRLVGCVAHVARRDDVEDALAEADRLLAADDGLSPEVRRMERARLAVRSAAYHRWYGDNEDAVTAARDGLMLLDRLRRELRSESDRLRTRLVLELVCALLDEGELWEAEEAAHPTVDEPVRATSAASVGQLMLAVATRVHLPSGEVDRGRGLLAQAAWLAERHGLDSVLADALTELSRLDEQAGRATDALEAMRSARAAEQRRMRAVARAARHMLVQVGAANGGKDVTQHAAALLRQLAHPQGVPVAVAPPPAKRSKLPPPRTPQEPHTPPPPAEEKPDQATTDKDTGLLDREGLFRKLRSVRKGDRPVALTLVRFEPNKDSADPNNDDRGPDTGIMVGLADKVRDMAPEDAEVARSDGGELAVLLPHTTRDQAEEFAATIRETAMESDWLADGSGKDMSISTGVVQSDPQPNTQVDAASLLTAARDALTPAHTAPPTNETAPMPSTSLDDTKAALSSALSTPQQDTPKSALTEDSPTTPLNVTTTSDPRTAGRSILNSLTIPTGSGGRRRAPGGEPPPGEKTPRPTEPAEAPRWTPAYPSPPVAGPAHTGTLDADPTRSGTTNARPTHSGTAEAGPTYPGVAKAGPTYSGAMEAGPTYPGAKDTGSAYSGTAEAGPTYPGVAEAGPTYSGAMEAGPTYSGPTGPAATDSRSAYSSPTEAGSTGFGPAGAGPRYSGAMDTGSAYSGVIDSRPADPGPTEQAAASTSTPEPSGWPAEPDISQPLRPPTAQPATAETTSSTYEETRAELARMMSVLNAKARRARTNTDDAPDTTANETADNRTHSAEHLPAVQNTPPTEGEPQPGQAAAPGHPFTTHGSFTPEQAHPAAPKAEHAATTNTGSTPTPHPSSTPAHQAPTETPLFAGGQDFAAHGTAARHAPPDTAHSGITTTGAAEHDLDGSASWLGSTSTDAAHAADSAGVAPAGGVDRDRGGLAGWRGSASAGAAHAAGPAGVVPAGGVDRDRGGLAGWRGSASADGVEQFSSGSGSAAHSTDGAEQEVGGSAGRLGSNSAGVAPAAGGAEQDLGGSVGRHGSTPAGGAVERERVEPAGRHGSAVEQFAADEQFDIAALADLLAPRQSIPTPPQPDEMPEPPGGPDIPEPPEPDLVPERRTAGPTEPGPASPAEPGPVSPAEPGPAAQPGGDTRSGLMAAFDALTGPVPTSSGFDEAGETAKPAFRVDFASSPELPSREPLKSWSELESASVVESPADGLFGAPAEGRPKPSLGAAFADFTPGEQEEPAGLSAVFEHRTSAGFVGDGRHRPDEEPSVAERGPSGASAELSAPTYDHPIGPERRPEGLPRRGERSATTIASLLTEALAAYQATADDEPETPDRSDSYTDSYPGDQNTAAGRHRSPE